MLAYFGERISPHMTDTPEGYLICHDVPIGRTGEMEYLAQELGLDGEAERRVTVHREAAEVFSPAALASFEGKPVTDGHPPESVCPENFGAYERGHVQNVRRDGAFMVADLYIKDAGLLSDVRGGVKREVSCGYSCRYVPAGDGYLQTEIRGNHVAVVPKGRAGREVAIKDAAIAANQKGGPLKMRDKKQGLFALFSQAAKHATPEELEQLTQDAVAVLDAEPEKTDAPAPARENAADGLAAGGGLEAKLDQLLELMRGLAAAEKPAAEDAATPEEKLDKTLAELSADAPSNNGSAEVVEEKGGTMNRAVTDTAAAILRLARPAIAAMKDPAEKRRVTDALLESIRTVGADVGAKLLAATSSVADKNTQDAMPAEVRAKAQQAAYDARNPHRKKED